MPAALNKRNEVSSCPSRYLHHQWRQQEEKRHLKKNTLAQLWLFYDYSILFRFYNVGEEPYNWIGLRADKLNT